MKLQGNSMRFLRFLHIITTSVWFGGTVCIGILAYSCFFSFDQEYFLKNAPMINWLYSSAVMFFALATLVEGIIYGALTQWGFFKHGWVIWKWVLSIVLIPCVGEGTIGQMESVISKVEQQGFQGGFADGGTVLFFLALQVAIMILMIALSIYKWGKKRELRIKN